MRYIVYGVGAIGGVVAAALDKQGADVVGIARGARLAALQEKGLILRSPEGTRQISLDCVPKAADLTARSDDIVLLVVKGQDTMPALHDLRAAGFEDQPIFCVQNGVANETAALRFFPNVHGVNVMLPADYVDIHEAICWCSPTYGIFDVGRFPSGIDAADKLLAEVLTPGGIMVRPVADVMAYKYGKLLMNLGNIVQAALGRETKAPELIETLRNEGEHILDKAGIPWHDVGASDPRRSQMKYGEVDGATRVGSSTTQSLVRGTGSVETDYLNGEIVLLARTMGEEAPANAFAARLADRLARDGSAPGSISREMFAKGLGL
ncbi:MAG: 2-dehydropantoate 2-reductase N-terminal domain-containing protein [Pseudomonadota bacterium]